MTADAWLHMVFRPLIVAAMVGCVVLSIVDLGHVMFPAWEGNGLVVLSILVALEGYYSYRVLHSDVTRMSDPIKYRAVEMVMLFLAVRLYTLVHDRLTPAPAQVAALDNKTAAALILVGLCWLGATNTSRDLLRVGELPDHDPRYVPPIDHLTSRYFSAGAVLLVAAGLSRIQPSHALSLSRPSISGIVLNVLVYFTLGIVLLGQVRYSALQSRWRRQDMLVSGGLGGRWVRYSLAFLGSVAFLAFLLPTSYTVGILDLLGLLLSVLTGALLLFTYLILFPFGWLLAHLVHLGAAHPGAARPHHPLHPARVNPRPTSWSQLVKSILFWGIVLACVVYMLRSYLQHHPRVARLGSLIAPLFRALRRLWGGLWRRARGYAAIVRERVPRFRAFRSATASARARRFFRLSAASPREQVLYYYFSILRRAERQGLPRDSSQTPYEYSARLGPVLSEAEPDVNTLTQAFVEARYSAHEVAPVRAGWVRRSWQRVKDALQHRGRESTAREIRGR